MKYINNNLNYGKFFYFLLSLSLLVGFYFNEDLSGGGAFADFHLTHKFNIALKEDLFFTLKNSYIVGGTDHFPLGHYLVSLILFITEEEYYVRLIFCILFLSIPYLFYLNLITKFPKINKNILLFFACIIFLVPAYRYSAIWTSDHNTASIFFLLSTLFFLKWEKEKKYNNLNLNIILSVFFLSLALYCRQYYSIIFLYFMLIYFQKLSFITFIKLSFFVFLLSLPGFWLIFHQKTLLISIYSNDYPNSILVTSSILSFYLIPIFFFIMINEKKIFFKLYNEKKNKIYLYSFLSIIIVFLLSLTPFDYNYKVGGGFLLKLSLLFFNNYFLFYCTSIFGIILLLYLSSEDKNSLFLFLLFMFALSGYYIFQKYYEPTFLFIFFLILNTKIPEIFLRNTKNMIYLYIYISIYSASALINQIFQITKNL